SGQDWFGPSTPIQPIAPADVAGRAFDYAPGWNLTTNPRAYAEIPFNVLRRLADSYDPVRLIIERRKDQMCRLPWSIRVKHEDGKKARPKAEQLSPRTRALIEEVKDFFKFPQPQMSFRVFLRAILDDLLVIDAPAIYCERDGSGSLAALAPVDGA